MGENNRTALAAALSKGSGDDAVRLLAEAAADFTTKRIELVGPAVNRPPHSMPLRVAPEILPGWTLANQEARSTASPARNQAARPALPAIPARRPAPPLRARPAAAGSASISARALARSAAERSPRGRDRSPQRSGDGRPRRDR